MRGVTALTDGYTHTAPPTVCCPRRPETQNAEDAETVARPGRVEKMLWLHEQPLSYGEGSEIAQGGRGDGHR